MNIESSIEKALIEKFELDESSDLFVVEIILKKNFKLEVYVDSDNSLTLDTCRKLSRYLESQIEENSWLPEKYTLEVSSPGLERPLKFHRQYVKNVGRLLTIKTTSGETIEGRLKSLNETHVELERNKMEPLSLGFDQIECTKIVVTFK